LIDRLRGWMEPVDEADGSVAVVVTNEGFPLID
jgi:hypothetical protein